MTTKRSLSSSTSIPKSDLHFGVLGNIGLGHADEQKVAFQVIGVNHVPDCGWRRLWPFCDGGAGEGARGHERGPVLQHHRPRVLAAGEAILDAKATAGTHTYTR